VRGEGGTEDLTRLLLRACTLPCAYTCACARQVGFRHAYQAHQARLALFLKNKSATGGWTALRADVPAVPYLKVSRQAPLAETLGPGESATLVLSAECLEPFEACPECTVGFVSGSTGATHAYSLRLPVVATGFMEPVALAAADFMARWNALAPAAGADPFPKEQQVVFARSGGLAIDAAELARVRTTVLSAGLHLAPTSGLDDANPAALQATAAGTFRTGSLGPNGQRVSVGALVKLDAAGSNYRLTVRAVHGKVALALKNVIKAQLG